MGLRRVNQAIWLLCTGAREAAFRNIKTIAECLADELINAAKGSSNSYAIKKKDEIERGQGQPLIGFAAARGKSPSLRPVRLGGRGRVGERKMGRAWFSLYTFITLKNSFAGFDKK